MADAVYGPIRTFHSLLLGLDHFRYACWNIFLEYIAAFFANNHSLRHRRRSYDTAVTTVAYGYLPNHSEHCHLYPLAGIRFPSR